MTRIDQLVRYMDELLETDKVPDYLYAMNGLQLENNTDIRGIAAAVDFSTRAIEGTVNANANLLIVHHGMFWNGFEALKGATYRRLRLLIDNDIAVYSSHLPLDRHPTLGNNALLARKLGLDATGSFANYDGISIGLSGNADMKTSELLESTEAFAREHGGGVRSTPVSKQRRTKRWAMCTGAGASSNTLKEAIDMNVDTLIVGEGPHHTAVQAEENDITIIYAGHYATETLGVCALANDLSEKYQIRATFVNAPTGL